MNYISKAITLVIVLAVCTMVTSQANEEKFKCLYAVGSYRDCTCGVKYRIVEKRCCSSEECLTPVITTENFTCPFVCQNGGTYDPNKNGCLCPSGYYGICCEEESPICGQVHLKHTGVLTSLDFPQKYPNNAECIWKISTDHNRRIALGTKGNEFDIEPGSNVHSCNYDYVKVFDGNDDKAKSLGTFCGTSYFKRFFHTVISTGSDFYVKFKSDFIVRKKGFQLQYSVFFAGQKCGPFSTYTRTKGRITSPHYPLAYRPNEKCQWTITLKEKHDVILTFEAIDIIGVVNCHYGDSLLVSLRNNGNVKHLAKFCGNTIPESYKVVSEKENDEVVLTFHSDQTRQGMGFILRYRQVPSDSPRLTDQSGGSA